MIRVLQPPSNLMSQLLSGSIHPGIEAIDALRPLSYLLEKEVEDGVLVLNLMTKELLHLQGVGSVQFFRVLSNEDISILEEKLFLVPELYDEHKLVVQLRGIFGAIHNESEFITNFTILTTTGCNASCSYCCERGMAPFSMNVDTAEAIGDYLLRRGNPQGINLTWFGGEPLLNIAVIRRITRVVSPRISFQSSIVTNGLFFNEAMIFEAVKDWNLDHVQITLDGMEQIHNHRKAFKIPGVNAFQIIIRNIELLLNQGVNVTVRMNFDEENFEDIMSLSDFLYEQFGSDNRFSTYSFPIFQSVTSALVDKWKSFEMNVMSRFGNESVSFPRSFPENSCMADDGYSIVITPDGKLCLCEQLCDSSFVGSVFSGKIDHHVAELWKERIEETDQCIHCPVFPDCYQLRRCPSSADGCNLSYREGKILQLLHMIDIQSQSLYGESHI